MKHQVVLDSLLDAGIEFVVVGGTAAVLQAANYYTDDLDIVHRRAETNVDRLLDWCRSQHAYHRFDLANR